MINRHSLSRTSSVSLALTALALIGLAPQAATAQGVVSSTGVNLLASAPANVTQGQITSSTQTTAFQEQQNMTLANALALDISTPGVYATDASLTPSTLAAGTQVNSFFLYSDPTTNRPPTEFTGSITFDQDILGLIVRKNTLDASDAPLGATGTIYPTGSPADDARGFEFNGNDNDAVTFQVNGRTLTYDFRTAGAVDELRVVTSAAAVPEPSSVASFALAGLGLGGLLLRARRRPASIA